MRIENDGLGQTQGTARWSCLLGKKFLKKETAGDLVVTEI